MFDDVSDNRSKRMVLSFTPEEKELLTSRAREQGVHITTIIRRCLREGLGLVPKYDGLGLVPRSDGR